jgi:hypothetical protein
MAFPAPEAGLVRIFAFRGPQAPGVLCYNRPMRRILTSLLAVSSLAGAATALAAGEVYKWVDPKTGNTEYSHAMPAHIEGVRKIWVLDESTGVTKRVVEYLTPEEELQRELTVRREAEQKGRDRSLLKTYLSIEEIERLRDERIGTLDAQIEVKGALLYGQEKKLAEIKSDLANYNFPVQQGSDLPPAPENLLLDYQNTLEAVSRYQGELADLEGKKLEMSEQFAEDIKRFRELKGTARRND